MCVFTRGLSYIVYLAVSLRGTNKRNRLEAQ